MSSRGRWFSRIGKRSAVVAAAASAAASFSSSVWAVNNTFTFTAGGTSWSNPSVWLFGNPFPNGVNEIANFTAVDLAPIGPIQHPITLDLNVTLGTLVFSDTAAGTPGGWILTPGGSSTLTMDTGINSQPIITVNNLGNNAAVSFVDMQVPVFGVTGFTKNGAGLLRLSASNGFSGSINVNAGTLEVGNNLNLGTLSSAIIQLSGGTLSLRSDSSFNLTSKTLLITGNSGLNVDRSAINTTSTVSGITDHVGTISMGTGARSLTITGNNFFGVSVGTLVLDPTNSAAVISDLAPGQLTISNVIGGSATTASTITFGGTGTNSTGSSLSITNAITQTSVSGTLSVVYSDTHTLTVGSFVSLTGNLIVSGVGSLVVQSGKLPTGSLGVQTGTLDFSTTNQDSTVTHLSLGGINNASGGYINTGAGGTLSVSGNVTFSSSVNGLGSTLDGKLNLGTGLHSLQINGIANIPTQEVTVNAVTNGSGTLVKGGTGQILFTGANNLSTAVVINQGTFSGAARSSGNALTSGAVTISGGTLRLVNQTASAGTGSIGSLDFNGAATNPAFLVIDSGASNATTSLKIGTFLGRVANTTGALTIIPRNGGLDSTEAIFAGSIAPAVGPGQNHGILAPYVAAQVSASNTSIDFLGISGTAPNIRIGGGAAAYKTDDINLYSGGTAVFFANNVPATLTAPRSLFALKADGTLANIGGSQTLTLGDGTLAGLIVNNGASVTASNLLVNAAEAIFWSGGQVLDVDGTTVLAAGGTITSNLSFASTTQGALTTAGAQTLTFSGGFSLGGVSRTVTVSNGTAVFSGSLSTGNLTKAGPNYLFLNGDNSAYNGALRVSTGTLQIGQGTLTGAATLGPAASITIDNGNVVFNLNGTRDLNNIITNTAAGTGALIVDSPTGVLAFTNGSSSFSSLTIQSGNVRLTGNNQLPNAATLTVQNTGSFDMNGFSQTIGALNGTVGTGIVTNTGGVPSTLTLNRTAANTSTFSGRLDNGVGGLALNKLGAGTQILIGSNGYQGGTRIVAGVLQTNNNTSAGSGSIQMLGGTLALNNTSALSNQIVIGNSTGTITVVPGGNTGTLLGSIAVSGGTLAAVYSGNNGTISIANVAPATISTGMSPANFNGTIAFFSTGGGTGSFRLPQITNLSTDTINFGTAGVQMVLNQVSTFGTVLGGSNASFAASGTAAIGDGGGTSSFAGAINSNLNKVGLGTFIVSSTTVKNHGMGSVQILGGALVFGQNARLSSPNLTVNIGTFTKAPGDPNILNQQPVLGDGGDLYFAGDANFTGAATVNLTNRGKWDVSGVPGGYGGASGLTIQGSGLIAGAYNHNAGTFMPGGAAKTGTITFNTAANPSFLTFGDNGSVQLDFTSPGATQIGGGTNDLIYVNGDVNFNPNTFYRFNYIGSGSVQAGQDYPLMQFTGGSTGWGTGGSLSTVAGKVRSPFRGDMVLKAISPGVIAAHVNNVTNDAQVITWTGTESSIFDLNLHANFKDVGGAGTTFFQGDTVVFDNNAIFKPTIAVEQSVFLPAAIIVNNGSNSAGVISIGRTGGGSVANDGQVGTFSGSMKLIKNGTGQLNIGNWNTYTGGVDLNGGTLNSNNGAWVERYFDHIVAAGGGVGPITFNSVAGVNDATLTNTNGPTLSNDIVFPAGKTGNLAIFGQQQYILGPFHGTGTVQFWGNGQYVLRNSWADFHGTAVMRSTAATLYEGPYALGTDVNWQFVVPSTVDFSWKYDFHGADGGAVDIDMGQLTGTANFASAGTGRRYGILHIGNTNTNSLWQGNSRNADASLVRRAGYMGVTKEGTGSLVMTGSHGYTGDTTVNAGIMQLSNTGNGATLGGAGNPDPGRGVMTGTRKVLVRGGTFRLGTPGGGVLQGNAGTILTATTGLLMSVDSGGTIDVSNAYNADAIVDPDTQEVLDYQAFGTAAGLTWAGNGGNVKGVVRHEAGTISPGRDSGNGSFGSVNFVDALELRGGTILADIGSTTSDHDTIFANNLDVGGGTVVVNVVGGSAAANSVYTLMSGSNFFGSVNSFQGLVVQGRGASGTLQQGGPTGHDVQLKILAPGTTASITWAGANGGSWDVRGSQSWINSTNTPDFFYHGDTVTFTDQGAGSIALASNLMPAGEVRVNNTGTNTWTFGGNGGIGGSASLHKMGTGTLKLLGTHTYSGGTTIDAGGTLTVGADNRYDTNGAANTPVGAANYALQNANPGGQAGTGSIVVNGALVFGGSDALVIKNNVSGSGAVYFRDTGAYRLDGQFTHTGGTTMESGGIILGRDNALPTLGAFNMVNNGSVNSAVQNVPNGGSGGASIETSRLDLHGFEQTILELNSFGVGSNTVIYSSDLGHTSISTLTIGRTGPGGFGGTIRQNKDLDNAVPCMVALTKMSDGTPGGGVATINTSTIGVQATYHHAYGGRTNINAGTFIYIGTHEPGINSGGDPNIAHTFGTYTVAKDAALGGSFTIRTHVDMQKGSILAPGFSDSATFSVAAVDLLSLDSDTLGSGTNSTQIKLDQYGNATDQVLVLWDNGLTFPTANSKTQINLNVVTGAAGTFTVFDYQGAALPDLLSRFQLNVTGGGTYNFSLLNNLNDTEIDLVVTQPIVSTTWQVDNNGTWSTGANWTTNPTTPNALGSTANFGSISAPRTVTMDGAYNIGTANFTSAAAFTIAGGNSTTLTLGNLTPTAGVGINVTQGSHAINVPVSWSNSGTINVAAGAQLRIGGNYGLDANGSFSGHDVTKDGAGTLLTDAIRNTFGNNGTATLRIKQGNVQMLHHTTANVNSSRVNTLTIDNGAKLDLTNNSLAIDYTGGAGSTIVTQLRDWLKPSDARLFSSDADSTHGLGYRDNADNTGAGNRPQGNFAGVTVDVSSVLIRYTYLGDTNVDGQVDISDLYNLASHYTPTHGAGTGTATWQSGDVNYDGWVDLADLSKLTTNWQAGVGNPLGSGLGSSLGPLLTSLGLPNIAVPEPCSVGLMGLGLTGLMARRRRRA